MLTCLIWYIYKFPINTHCCNFYLHTNLHSYRSLCDVCGSVWGLQSRISRPMQVQVGSLPEVCASTVCQPAPVGPHGTNQFLLPIRHIGHIVTVSALSHQNYNLPFLTVNIVLNLIFWFFGTFWRLNCAIHFHLFWCIDPFNYLIVQSFAFNWFSVRNIPSWVGLAERTILELKSWFDLNWISDEREKAHLIHCAGSHSCICVEWSCL